MGDQTFKGFPLPDCHVGIKRGHRLQLNRAVNYEAAEGRSFEILQVESLGENNRVNISELYLQSVKG